MKLETQNILGNLCIYVANEDRIEKGISDAICKDIIKAIQTELKADRVSATNKEHGLDMIKFVDTKEKYRTNRGVHYQDGKAYSTDTHILVINRQEYPTEWEGKTIDKDGNEVTGRFPDCEAVVPEWDDLTPMGTLTKTALADAIKVCKALSKAVMAIISKDDAGKVVYITLTLAKRLQAYLNAKGAVPVWTMKKGGAHRTMYSRDDTSTLVVMGCTPKTDLTGTYELQI